MTGWQREMREEDFSGRRVVLSVSEPENGDRHRVRGQSPFSERTDRSVSPNAPFGAAITCLAEMTSDCVTWLWGDVLAQGKVTLLTGASGAGKSFVAMKMAAAVTRGERDSRAETRGEPSRVLLISPEAELADVVRPRLLAAEAEMTRVHALRGIRRSPPNTDDSACRAFQLDEDLRLLEREIAQREAAGTPLRLIVIDPFPVELFAYRYGTADLVRTMRYLAEIAAWSHVAILLVADNSSRLSGSWGNLNQVLHATAQSVWTIVDGLEPTDPRVFFPYPPNYQGPRDDEPESEPERLLLSVKANLKRQSAGLSFRLDDGRVEWNPVPVEMTAEQYSSRQYDRCRSSSLLMEQEWSELARATHWLKRRLTTGVTALREIKRAALEHDISFSTLRRAFCGLKGVARRIGNSRLWGWALPEHDAESGRLPQWLNVEEDDAVPACPMRPSVEASHQPEPVDNENGDMPRGTGPVPGACPPWPVEAVSDGPASDQPEVIAPMPDEVAPLPNGEDWTWKRTKQEHADEVGAFATGETRLPYS